MASQNRDPTASATTRKESTSTTAKDNHSVSKRSIFFYDVFFSFAPLQFKKKMYILLNTLIIYIKRKKRKTIHLFTLAK